jgi:hypothetical protein
MLACVRVGLCAVVSGVESMKTMVRGLLAGACAFLTKPLCEEVVRDVWQHVVRRHIVCGTAAPIADALESLDAEEDDRGKKRGSAGLGDSGEGGSTKRSKVDSSAELHAAVVGAAEELRGTEGKTASIIHACMHMFGCVDNAWFCPTCTISGF